MLRKPSAIFKLIIEKGLSLKLSSSRRDCCNNSKQIFPERPVTTELCLQHRFSWKRGYICLHSMTFAAFPCCSRAHAHVYHVWTLTARLCATGRRFWERIHSSGFPLVSPARLPQTLDERKHVQLIQRRTFHQVDLLNSGRISPTPCSRQFS